MTAPVSSNSIIVIKAGLLDTVQDQGRPDQAHIALSRGGAMDPDALALANAMVGNSVDAAGLEITGPGPTLQFQCDAWIASVGARHGLQRLGSPSSRSGEALPTQRPLFVRAGSLLRWTAPARGLRSWLAVAGGIDELPILSSRSAHLASGIGPARLVAGTVLAIDAQCGQLSRARASAVLGKIDLDPNPPWPKFFIADDLPLEWPLIDLPVLPGRHFKQLSADDQASLLSQDWTVSSQSNRQGLRLQGQAIDTSGLPHLASEPVSTGTVQLPPAGEPVILLSEHQTTGGYPRVLEVASGAQRVLAQAGASCRIRFRLISLEQADRLAQTTAREFMQRLSGLRQTCSNTNP
jgi:antagonist of KipI